jgi:uncharacterized protein YndB with AHSA1/START domain
MPDIFHQFPIKASVRRVFQAVATPEGLDSWWTKRSSGTPVVASEYELWFGPKYDWRAIVSWAVLSTEFELEMTGADQDWLGTRVGFHLQEKGGVTQVRFHHTGWPASNDHYRVSCFCWAMYLRLLKRYVEFGEQVPYEERLSA